MSITKQTLAEAVRQSAAEVRREQTRRSFRVKYIADAIDRHIAESEALDQADRFRVRMADMRDAQ